MIRRPFNVCVPKAILAGTLLLGACVPCVQAQYGLVASAGESRTYPGGPGTPEEQARIRIRNKLTGIIIPRVEFRSTTLSSAVEYLRQESARLDPDPDPQRRGVNLLLRLPPLTPAAAPVAAASPDGANAASGPAPEFVPTANMRITVNLSRIPLQEALQYVASEAGLKLRVEPYAVCLVPLNDHDETMITKVFRVPPNLISNATGTFGNTALDQPATAAH